MTQAPQSNLHDRTPEQAPPPPHQPKSNLMKYLLFGCLGTILLAVIITVIATVVIVKNWRGVTASFFKKTTHEFINNAQIPEDQKARIITRLDSLADDFKNEKLTIDQMEAIGSSLPGSPLLNMGMVLFFDQVHLQPSNLSGAEKLAGRRVLERVARGVVEESIYDFEIRQLTDPIMDTKSNGKKQPKKHLTDTELREFLTNAKKLADDAEIPDEPYVVDMAAELDKIIDNALHPKPANLDWIEEGTLPEPSEPATAPPMTEPEPM